MHQEREAHHSRTMRFRAGDAVRRSVRWYSNPSNLGYSIGDDDPSVGMGNGQSEVWWSNSGEYSTHSRTRILDAAGVELTKVCAGCAQPVYRVNKGQHYKRVRHG